MTPDLPHQPGLAEFLHRAGAPQTHRPWPRVTLDRDQWLGLRDLLVTADWSLLSLWADAGSAFAALRDEGDGAIGLVSLPSPSGRFPSLGGVRPGALRMERWVRDLGGLAAEDNADTRPWLDHGTWALAQPLSPTPAPMPTPREPEPYAFLAAEGPGLHQIPVGPVHAGIIEPGHFRFTANGETVVRLEERLGYVHKGTQHLMAGKTPSEAARLAARISGDSTVAHGLAFACAVEAAVAIEPPPRAVWLRALMAELERLANHFGDVGAVCNDASFVLIHAECGYLRERVLQTAQLCFGHRLMMGRVVPGGVAVDLNGDGRTALSALIPELRAGFARVVRIYDAKASLLDRTVATGITSPALVHRFAAGGYVGRAAGRAVDARSSPGYAPYSELEFEVPVLPEGDVNARVWIRIHEVEQSLRLIEQILARLPAGPLSVELSGRDGEGAALVESYRGDIFTWVRIDAAGRIAACWPRDPSWLQWPLLEAAIEGNIVADFPLCNKSFNASYSGHDL
jgi:Ni,Fe-hydrogenase III large subunit